MSSLDGLYMPSVDRLTRHRPFEATNVWVRLYWRATDHRARILFLTLDPSGRRMRYCFPLTGLKVLRTESNLQLCRVNREDGRLDLWANLRFTLYERKLIGLVATGSANMFRHGAILLHHGSDEAAR